MGLYGFIYSSDNFLYPSSTSSILFSIVLTRPLILSGVEDIDSNASFISISSNFSNDFIWSLKAPIWPVAITVYKWLNILWSFISIKLVISSAPAASNIPVFNSFWVIKFNFLISKYISGFSYILFKDSTALVIISSSFAL